MCVCVCVCMSLYVCVCVSTLSPVFTGISCTCMYVCVCACVYMCVCVKLLKRNASKRLNVKQIRAHKFFTCINWSKLKHKHVKPPIIPILVCACTPVHTRHIHACIHMCIDIINIHVCACVYGMYVCMYERYNMLFECNNH